jgi:ATP-dependent RNA helicase DDX31/DBP7
VAARGIDLPDVDLVVQMDAPSEVSEYVHRVGRTARSGRAGSAVLFLRESELEYCKVLQQHEIKITPIKTPAMYESLVTEDDARAHHLLAMEAKDVLQQRFESMVNTNKDLADMASKAFSSYVGAYAVHSSDTKHIFVPRALHLGHVAKSFALKEAPTKAGRQAAAATSSSSSSQKPSSAKKPRKNRPQPSSFEEFAAG